MLTKRIIPCLDIQNGRTVKGINFVNLQDAGDPVELAKAYVRQGADELVFLDITATIENRATLQELVQRIAKEINIPFTVGGGIHSLEDAEALLQAGADKLSINTAAVENPHMLSILAERFGSQCVVIAIDAKKLGNSWKVYTHGGRIATDNDVVAWAQQAEKLGAGEILLTSMDHDGTKNGFDIELTKAVSKACSIPVIASGGAGKKEHFYEVFKDGLADAALAASIFHYGEVPITGLKRYLESMGIPIRKSLTREKKMDNKIDVSEIDFAKGNGLIPAIVQDYKSGQVLMLGYMNEEAFIKTSSEGRVTFFSRNKQRLWTKGETSGNFLYPKEMYLDCDKDTLLILAEAAGKTCHLNQTTCFGEKTFSAPLEFIEELESVIHERKLNPQASSYTCNLFTKGLNAITKKVGEEASETIIAALAQDEQAFKGEVSDLIYHLLVLLEEKNINLEQVVVTLKQRHK